MNQPIFERLAVCSWSLQPSTPLDLLENLKAAKIPRVQLALDPVRESPEIWQGTDALLRENEITVVSGMFGCVAEDYSTLEAIRATGGIAPDSTWSENLAHIHATAAIAEHLGLPLVTFHAGFIPHEPADPHYSKLLERIQQVAEIFAAKNIAVALETGQEAAALLASVLEELDSPNLGVNFDPANMILYDQGDPIEAVKSLGRWIRHIHIKDAKRTTVRGVWGQEVTVGTGDVDWPGFFSALREIQFAGNLVIEREAGTQRFTDICRARDVVLKLNPSN
jgi:sugar phosphate isomerase/epimerase